jgi:hypothetical protein
LRGVFYQKSGSYCGYTWNENGWHNGPYSVNNGWQQLLAVTVSQSSWSGQLKAKIDPSDGNCQNSGTYYFKIQRYTGSGNSSFDDQNSLSVNIAIPTPTPTAVPTDTPTPTTTATPTPTPKLTATPTPKPTPSVRAQLVATIAGVLGESSISAEINTPTPLPAIIKIASEKSNNLLPKILIFIGIIFLVACVIVIFYPYVKEKLNRNKDE